MKATTSALMIAAACLAGATATPVLAQKIVREQPKQNYSISGADNYREYCAACHGISGKGDGPAAPALKLPTPDLTLIAQRNNGKFPEDTVRQIIVGDAKMPSHGDRDMPVWGPIFHNISAESQAVTDMRIRALLDYLRSMQQKP